MYVSVPQGDLDSLGYSQAHSLAAEFSGFTLPTDWSSLQILSLMTRVAVRSGTLLTLAVFLLGLGLAAGSALWWQHQIDTDAEILFQHSVERVSADIARRFRQPVYGLNGAKGMYAASKHIGRKEFLAYVETRDLPREFPGVRGFGFIARVMRPDLGAFVARERSDDAPEFAIRQLVDKDHDDLYVIKFIEPAAKNVGALGLDLGSEQQRRAALLRAIDSGEPTLTAAITLVQDQRKAPGVLLYVPMYEKGAKHASVAQRRASIAGLLFAPIVISELLEAMPDVGPGRMEFELYDAALGSQGGTLVYDAVLPDAASRATISSRFATTLSLPLHGREFTLHVASTPGFDAKINRWSSWLVFTLGALLSALLAMVLRQQATGRHRAELLAQGMTEQLQQDEARSRDFSMSASDWFWETDAEHRFCYFSDNFGKAYGLAPGQLLGKSRKEMLDQDGLNPPEIIAAHLARLEAHLPFKNFEYQIHGNDGKILWTAVSGVPHLDSQGRFAGYRGTGTIITARKQTEEELANQSRMLSEIIEATNVGTGQWNIQSGEIVFNERWANILGYTLAELSPITTDTWSSLVHPDDLKSSVDLLAKHFAGERPYHESEARMRHKDGHWVWMLSRGRVVRWTADGKPWLMSGTHQDISSRKDAEEHLRQAELLLRSAIETIGEAFVIYDPEDRLAYCNEQYREIYHSSAPAIEVGRSFEEIIRYGVERGQYKDAIGREEAWIAERLVAHRQGDQELIQKLDDGRWLKITERHTPSGHIVGFRVDVTELYRAKEAAEAATIAKSSFLSSMSHEIRTPMNGILGMAQMLLMPDLQEQERQDCARIILTSGQSLLSLLNDILDLSKVEAGKLELEAAPLDPAQIIHETRGLFAATAGEKGLKIEAHWAGAAGRRYLGDPHRLRQMLANLVGNAIKFTAQGHVQLYASEVERDGQMALLEFTVSDTGIGIPEEKQPLLFKPFSQADGSTTRQFGGTGLGLSIVRSLAKLMGGDVGIESKAGQGSSFWFRIRVGLIAPGTESRDGKRFAIEGDQAALMPAKLAGHILVVDDNATNRKVIMTMLNKPGLRCDFVEDGQQAVAAITGGMAPDLVLMDCQMPVMDGFVATRSIRCWEAAHGRPRLTIVALTAGAFEEDRKRCSEAGMDDFLAKPIVLDKLIAMLGRWLAVGKGEAARRVPAPETETPPQDDGPPVFDERTLLSQLGEDSELARSIVLMASDDIPGYFEQLEHAIAAGNGKDAARLIHTLKGLTAQLGGMRLCARIKEVDDHLKGGGQVDAVTVMGLRREYQTLAGKLQQWLG